MEPLMNQPAQNPQQSQTADNGVRHEASVVTNPIYRLGGQIAAALFFLAGTYVVFTDDDAPWWFMLFVIFVSVMLLGVMLVCTAVEVKLKRGVLEVSNGRRTFKVPTRAIAYIGRAEFTRRDVWRMGPNLTNGKQGTGIEIVTGDRKYITARCDSMDELFPALVEEGMDPRALQTPFPVDAVKYKHAASVQREQRNGQHG
ncbi:hypothetical protein IDM40_08935 [Nocardiopsis sp. HNM0947]|uniref:PH domain-containing protein n=2 Tax=Nocardiopsis coralli TaxID=2772213 RepID=A0ABR9P4U0_9ACTN|nr:hypothetical protein [Nocardiopsis coralli]